MPFLSISRDKRGYETTALLHAPAGRTGQSRPRLLYWFRTPPDVRVGLSPLCDEVRRAIESRHRDLSFDWDRILAGPGGPDTGDAPRSGPSRPGRAQAETGERRRAKRRRPRPGGGGADAGAGTRDGEDPGHRSDV